jgi:hypothetical protein
MAMPATAVKTHPKDGRGADTGEIIEDCMVSLSEEKSGGGYFVHG